MSTVVSLKPSSQAMNNSMQNSCHICDHQGGCISAQLTGLPEEDLVNRAHKVYKNGDHLFRAGQEAHNLYVVRSGSVMAYLVTETGEEQVMGFFYPGDIIGLDAMGQQGRLSSACCLETSSVCAVPLGMLNSEHNLALLKLISGQLSREHNLVLMLAKKDADSRLASFLYDLSQRQSQRGYASGYLNLSMSRQNISNFLGLAVETLSRTLHRFQDAGLLTVNRRQIEIHDVNALKQIAGAQVAH